METREKLICTSGSAIDGRCFEPIWIRQVVENTNFLITTRSLKPPIRPYHKKTETVTDKIGLQHVVATSVNEHESYGYLQGLYTKPSETNPGELEMWATLCPTAKATAEIDAGAYLNTSIGAELAGFSLRGGMIGPYVEHLALCGSDPAAFPETQLSKISFQLGSEFSVGEEKPQNFVQKLLPKKQKISLALSSNSEGSGMDYKAAFEMMAGTLGKLANDMGKMMAGADEPDGDEGVAPPPPPPGQDPASDRADDKAETQASKKAAELASKTSTTLANENAEMAAVKAELAAIRRDRIELTMQSMVIPKDLQPRFVKIAESLGLEEAKATFAHLTKTPPQGDALPGKPTLPQKGGMTAEARLERMFPGMRERLEAQGVSLSAERADNEFVNLKPITFAKPGAN